MKEFIIKNLDCANCAAKIENNLNKIKGIKVVSLNLINREIKIDSNKDIIELQEIVQNTCDNIEPGLNVVLKEENTYSYELKSYKFDFIKLLLYTLMLIMLIVLKIDDSLKEKIFIITYIFVSYDVIISGIKKIINGNVFSEELLMSIATIGAIFIKEYPEAISVILFYKFGELFQDMAVNNSRKSIIKLMEIKPDYANLLIGEDIKIINPKDVKIGDIILVKPGEKVPLDGVIIEGESLFNTVALTGESKPRKLILGDEVISGSVNINSVVKVKITKDFNNSTITKILDLVQNASSRKAKTEKFISKFARYYTPAVVLISILIVFIPTFILKQNFDTWLYRALIFLVVSCPCALVISVPVSYISGITYSSQKGILIKGANYLETMTHIDSFVFDKTGTLTKGSFNIAKIKNYSDLSDEEFIKLSAIIESNSNHPIAKSIVSIGKTNVKNQKIDNYEEISGKGIRVEINGNKYFSGNKELLLENGIEFIEENEMGTIVYIANENKHLGSIIISDEIKEDSKKTIDWLKDNRKDIYLLSGDNENTVYEVAKTLGIEKYKSELLPQEKLKFVENLIKLGKNIAFIGDGINDAPVIIRSNVGIAMGSLGSDAAIESADIVFMNDNPISLVYLLDISKKTRKIVIQNIVFALGIKILFMILGAMGYATMWEAVFADVGVAVLAILNASRLLFNKNNII